jgi:hypothetical protein
VRPPGGAASLTRVAFRTGLVAYTAVAFIVVFIAQTYASAARLALLV